MNDYELLKALQNELILTLKARKNMVGDYASRNVSKAKIHRLRLQIQEVMCRIEKACKSSLYVEKEAWFS